MDFQLVSDYAPTGDQPEAIAQLLGSIRGGAFQPPASLYNRHRLADALSRSSAGRRRRRRAVRRSRRAGATRRTPRIHRRPHRSRHLDGPHRVEHRAAARAPARRPCPPAPRTRRRTRPLLRKRARRLPPRHQPPVTAAQKSAPDGPERFFKLHVQVFLQGLHILLESPAPGRGHPAERPCLLADESFFHLDIPGRREFVELDAEVSGGGAGLFTEIDEVRFGKVHQHGHDRQPQLRMKQRIKLFHCLCAPAAAFPDRE